MSCSRQLKNVNFKDYIWYLLSISIYLSVGTQWRSCMWQCATSHIASIPDGVIENFSLTYFFRPYYGHEADSACNRNSPGTFPGE
jgi:hypothetical protein